MPSTTIYSRRLRSGAKRIDGCRCKVGSCPICGSKCRRCMCSCDGIEPSDALSRSRGGYRRHANAIKKQRDSASDIQSKNILPSNKKRRRSDHFQKVGLIRDSGIKKRRKISEKNTKDSDSDYVDEDDNTSVEECNSSPIIPTDDFTLEIDTNESSIPDNIVDNEITIAEKVMTLRKENQNSKNEILEKKTVCRTKKREVSSRTHNLEELLKLLNIENYWIRHLPSFQIRELSTNIKESSSNSTYNRLVSLATKMVESTLKVLCPGPGYEELKSDILCHLYKKQTKKRSSMVTVIGNDTNDKSTENKSTNPYKRTVQEKLDSVVTTLCTWSNKSFKGSIERRVIRAVLNESFLRHEITEMKDSDLKLKQGTGHPVMQARSDADLLRVGKKLSKTIIRRQKKNDNTIKKCVDFILSDANVASVSWGSKVVLTQSLGEVTLPKLTRKTPIHNMYLKYKGFTKDDDDRLKSTSFYLLCNIFSTNDDAMLSSIDYVTGLLVNETCETLQDIVERLVPIESRTECSKFITVAKNFMKNQYKDRIMIDDNCCFHGLKYALSRDMAQRDNTNDNGCKFPFFLCHHLKSLISNKVTTEEMDDNELETTENIRKDAIDVIDSISEKFKLFLAHQARCKCQMTAISLAEEDIKQTTIKSGGKHIKGLIIMDFKMKYAMKSTRETTIEHFGKRGIGWHGFAVIYYQLDDDRNPYRNIVYLDQILNDTNKQDGAAVVALLEVAIVAIISELPFMKEAIITSDNATCYQSHFLTFMMSIYNKKFEGKFFISAFVHTETQDGKSLLDAHFATSNRHLILFMKTWRSNRITRINTARGLAYALSFNLGLKNSMVQLVEINRQTVEHLKKIFDKLIVKCGEYYNRVNHIVFDKTCTSGWSNNEINQDNHVEKIKNSTFNFAVMAYSNVTTPVQFCVSVKEQTLTVDEQTQNMIESILENNHVAENKTTDDNYDNDESENHGSVADVMEAKMVESVEGTTNELSETTNVSQQDMEEGSDFSTFRKSKVVFMEKLETLGALSLLGISPNDGTETTSRDHLDGDEADLDSDYSDNDTDSDSDELDNFFLSKDDIQTYADAPSHLFDTSLMITATNVCRWLPLGVIRSKKTSGNKHRSISSKSMIKGLADTAVIYAKNNITQNNLFQSRHAVDPVVMKAANFKIHPFENGWAKRKAHGRTYGVSYVHAYEGDLTEMYQKGMRNSSSKMSAGKMRENLLSMYPGRFSIPGETEIKQFIGKLTQTNKAHDPLKSKSTRGRKAGNGKKSWYMLLNELIDKNPSEKPETIFRLLIENLGDNLPDDLPKTTENAPDKKKIKSTIARFKTKLKKDAKRSIIV